MAVYSIKCLLCLLIATSYIVITHGKADNARLQKIKPWDIKMVKNGYNFLVGISEDVPIDMAEELVDKIKIALTRASRLLFDVTRKRSAFGNITIVVPNSWESLGYPLAKGETVDKGNFYVYNDTLEAEPFTLKYFKGSQSDRGSRSIMLHDGYMIKKGGDPTIGVKILEEWITLRFGLEMDYAKFANDIDQTKDCVDGAQNSVCEGLQADIPEWSSKIQKSDGEPNFIVVRQRRKRIIVVLDVSGSMEFRMTKARQGIIRYFEHLYDLTLDDYRKGNTLVAAVKFSTNASPLGNLSFVTSDEFDLLGSKISLLEAEEKTSIGAGLLQAMEILNKHPDGKLGAEVILISDGMEDTQPYMNETWDEILESKVVVHTIGFSRNADSRVDALGAATGGLTFIHNDGDSGNDLEQAFLSISDYENSDPAATGIVVFSNRLNRSESNGDYNISVDALLRKDLTFYFECAIRDCIRGLIVTMEAPDNRTLRVTMNAVTGTFNTSEYRANQNQSRIAAEMTIQIFSAMPGIWRIKTRRVYGLGMTITAFPNNPGQYPILAFCFWGLDRIVPNQTKGTQTMNALVSRGNNPVIGANVTGIVVFGSKTANFTLKDDGQGGDLYPNDGIYTARFLKKNFNFSADQRYNLKVKVDGTRATKVRTRQLVAVSPGRNKIAALGSSDEEPAFDLQRLSVAGSFIAMGTNEPPSLPERIEDLKATIFDHENGAIILTWTAPFDPFYSSSKRYGNIYDIRFGYSEEGIMRDPKKFDSETTFRYEFGTLRAGEEGTEQKLAFTTQYSGYEHKLFFTVTTVRRGPQEDVKSERSNIVGVTLIRCNDACRRGRCVTGISSCQCEDGVTGENCDQWAGK